MNPKTFINRLRGLYPFGVQPHIPSAFAAETALADKSGKNF